MSEYTTAIILNASMPCGSALLKYSLLTQQFSRITAFYKEYPAPSPFPTTSIVAKSFGSWIDQMPRGDIVFSALGFPILADDVPMTQGGKSDFEWNYEFAKAAKARSAKAFVLIVPYEVQKQWCLGFCQNQTQVADLEQSIKDLGFDTLIILEPGPLMDAIPNGGDPYGGIKRLIDELPLSLYNTPLQFLAGYPIYSDQIGKAAVSLGLRLSNGTYRLGAAQLLKEVSANGKTQKASAKSRAAK